MILREYKDLRIAPFSALLDSQIGLPDHQGGPDFFEWDHEIESRHCRYGRLPIDIKPKPPIRELGYVKGEFAYIGPLCQHFGHQVADFSMRILPTLSAGFDGSFIFGSKYNGTSNYSRTPKYFQEIISWFSISSQQILLPKDDVVFEKVYIAPQAETIFGPAPSDDYLDLLREHYLKKIFKYGSLVAKKEPIVYISRSRIQRGVFAGEAVIERYMRKIGARVVFPELEKTSNLLQIYNNAEYIVGGEGSAFHLMQLLGKQLSNIIIIRRSANKSKFGDNFLTCRCKNLKYIDAVVGGISGREDGRYREEGLVVLDFDLLRNQLLEALPVDEPMNGRDFESDVKDSVSRWLLNYWYKSKNFTDNSLNIIIEEARKAHLNIDPDDLNLAKTKNSPMLSRVWLVGLIESHTSCNLHIREIRAAITLGLSGDNAGLNVLWRTVESSDAFGVDYGEVAQAAYKLGEHLLAKNAIRRALDDAPSTYWLWELQTHIFMAFQDWDGAKRSALTGLAIDPLRPDLLFLLSRIHFEKKEYFQALEKIDQALKIQHKHHFFKLKLAIKNLLDSK